MNNLLKSSKIVMLQKNAITSFLSMNKNHNLHNFSQLFFPTNTVVRLFNSAVRSKSNVRVLQIFNWNSSKNILRSIQKGKFFTTVSPIHMNEKFVTYKEVKDLPNHPEKLLIDVREKIELKRTGCIPTSINIPLRFVQDSLELSPEKFEKKYGRCISKTKEIIFYCRTGARSGRAAGIAHSLGYTNVKSYKGSWREWSKKEEL